MDAHVAWILMAGTRRSEARDMNLNDERGGGMNLDSWHAVEAIGTASR
jgi:hypothetical protein